MISHSILEKYDIGCVTAPCRESQSANLEAAEPRQAQRPGVFGAKFIPHAEYHLYNLLEQLSDGPQLNLDSHIPFYSDNCISASIPRQQSICLPLLLTYVAAIHQVTPVLGPPLLLPF